MINKKGDIYYEKVLSDVLVIALLFSLSTSAFAMSTYTVPAGTAVLEQVPMEYDVLVIPGDVLDAALAASFSSEKDTPDLAQIYAAGGKDAETISVNEYSSMVNKIVS